MLFILFLCGILSADICVDLIKDSRVLMDLETYKGYANAKIVFRDAFWNIMYERIKLFIFLFLLCFTPLRKYLSGIIVSVFSYIWGFFIMSCVIELGLAGVLVGMASVIPHGLLYGALILMILGVRDTRSYTHHNRGQLVLDFMNIMIILLLFITGCVLEALVSTHFVPWVIRLSLI